MLISQDSRLSIDTVAAFARGAVPAPALSRAPDFQQRIRDNRAFLERRISLQADIYGVTTGFGSSSRNTFSTD